MPRRSTLTDKETTLKAYILASGDLMFASRCCDLIEKQSPNEADELHYFLNLALVICYARPFSGNRPRVNLPKSCTRFRTSEQLDAHKTAVRIRNRVYAHSDADVRNVEITPKEIDIYLEGKRVIPSQRFYMQSTGPVFPASKLPALREAISFVRARLQLELAQLRDAVHSERGRPTEKFTLGEP
jgi:hypothetical protein